jgi:Spy/CpxP family protein refolding chaperone
MLLAMPVLAQDAAPQDQPAAHAKGQRGGRGGDQLGMLTKRLDLTADQQEKIKPILADRQAQMKALHEDTATAGADKRTKMKSIMDSTNAKIRAVLTPDQQTKFDQMQAEMKNRGQGRKQRQQGGGDAPQQAPE